MTTTKVARWRNSLGVRLPKSVVSEARLDEGDTVVVSVDRGTIIIRSARPRQTLDGLVKRITARNRHSETEWGGATGRELQ
jgi:antitoxin MazE